MRSFNSAVLIHFKARLGMATYRYDVFVSYSSIDRGWVQSVLVPRLEGNAFSVMVDYRDFQSGGLGVDEMQRGVEESRRTLLVLTANYVRSSWTHFEHAMAQASDPAGRWRRIIPVLVSDCVLPLRLQIIHRRDLRSNDPVEWDLLMRDLM